MDDSALDKLFVQNLGPGETFKKTFSLRGTDDRATVLRYISKRTSKELTRIDLDIWNYNQSAA